MATEFASYLVGGTATAIWVAEDQRMESDMNLAQGESVHSLADSPLALFLFVPSEGPKAIATVWGDFGLPSLFQVRCLSALAIVLRQCVERR